jgi:GDPmannose 4,6-dehydratase
MFASNGILFNHESPRRGVNFVTRKITRLACMINLGMIDKINLGNLEAKRDWGFSGDYMNAIYLIMQHDHPDDFKVSTGEAHTVREFAEKVFTYLGLDFYKYLVADDSFKRPVEVPYLCGDSTKIRKELGWEPKVGFEQLLKMMVDSDMEKLNKIKLVEKNNELQM